MRNRASSRPKIEMVAQEAKHLQRTDRVVDPYLIGKYGSKEP